MPTSPKYFQVAQDILQSINSGGIGVGEALPSEVQLCSHYGVSRITVRAAMRALSERGLVSRRAGVGTHVLRKEAASQFVHTSESLDSVLQFTESMHLRVVAHGWLDATQAQDSSPGEKPEPQGKKFFVRVLRIDAQELPICLSEFHFSALHQSILEHLPGLQGSIILRMEKIFGIALHSIDQVFDASKLSASQARMLQVKIGAPVMRVRRWHRDSNGDVLLHSINHYPSDRYSYKLQMQRNAGIGRH